MADGYVDEAFQEFDRGVRGATTKDLLERGHIVNEAMSYAITKTLLSAGVVGVDTRYGIRGEQKRASFLAVRYGYQVGRGQL